jgi:hypothetical protein
MGWGELNDSLIVFWRFYIWAESGLAPTYKTPTVHGANVERRKR